MNQNYIIRPVVTEKTVANGQDNKFTFIVTADANKISIKTQLFHAYGVMPEKVTVVNMPVKKRTMGRRVVEKRKEHKRATVTFPKGANIDIFKLKATKATKEKTSTSN